MASKVKFLLVCVLAVFCFLSALNFRNTKMLQAPCIEAPKISNPYVHWRPSSGEKQFKTRGLVYDCLSRKILRTYDGDSINKKSIPIKVMETDGEESKARQDSFKAIFDQQTWGGKENGIVDKMNEDFKASGPGSELKMTVGCMALLHGVIEQLKVQLNKDIIHIADIPCGDLQWMGHFLKTRTDIQYTGIDIVPTLIDRHTNTYKNNPNINFRHIDVASSPLNQSFDIIFSRQMMQHLKNSDIIKTLHHFSQSGSKYMIATTYSNMQVNRELGSTTSIRFRTINLEKAPYNLIPPVCTYQEPILKDNYLGMWELPLRITQG